MTDPLYRNYENGKQRAPFKLPPPTLDQVEYLEKIRRATEDYDGTAIIGGPKKEKAMAGTFWVIESARQTYWDGRQCGDRAVFSDKISEAIKFLDSESADRIRSWLLEKSGCSPVLRSVEHSYVPEIIS